MWKSYHNLTKNLKPHSLTKRAIKYAKKDSALDLGAGALRDTNFLLKHFKLVVAVDKEYYKHPFKQGFSYHCINFKDFKFKKYDFINAQFSLPFLNPKDFKKVWPKILNSLNPNGVFCGNFFGVEDDWAYNKNMTFHKEVKSLFKDFHIKHYKEIKDYKKTASGYPKWWHIFEVIAIEKEALVS